LIFGHNNFFTDALYFSPFLNFYERVWNGL